MSKCFSEQVKRFLKLDNICCTVRWDLEAIGNSALPTDAQQAIEIDCPKDEAAEQVLAKRLGLSYAALEMGITRINLKVQGELYLPLSPQITVALGTGIHQLNNQPTPTENVYAFIKAALLVAADCLEPFYWVDRHVEQEEPIVTFICRAPKARYAAMARQKLINLPLGYPVYFQLWTPGEVSTNDKERLIKEGRPYLDQPQKALGAV